MSCRHFAVSALLALGVFPALAATESGACAAVPSVMRAARLHAPGGPEALRIEQLAVPKPGAGEVLVRVHYASINPVDWKLQESGRLPYPATPGGDFSGEIVGLGSGVEGYACGDLVAGIVNQRERNGSYAEYLTVPLDGVVAKPTKFSAAEAAAYPTVTVAAWRFLVAAAQVQAGERVLIHGAAGGVGSMAVQMAKARGALVIGTASARNHPFLRRIGADQVIDYQSTPFETVVSGVDVVIDTVGGDTLRRSEAVLRDGGRLVTMVGSVPSELCASGRIACPQTPAWNVQAGLAYAAPMIASGQLQVHLDAIYPLSEISAAQQHNRDGRTRGKVVVAMATDGPVATATGASATDIAAAMVPLQAYLDGHASGQEHQFRRAFAADAMLVGIKDGIYNQRPGEDYIKASASGQIPADESRRQRWIRSINLTGKVASAVIELDYPHMRALDHMSLLQLDGEWRIVVKAYEAFRP